jgi:hypothetical protein
MGICGQKKSSDPPILCGFLGAERMFCWCGACVHVVSIGRFPPVHDILSCSRGQCRQECTLFGGEGITVPVLPKLVWLTWNGFLLSVASFGSFVGSRYLIPSHDYVHY